MGKDTKIQWCHHTFNPWRGCTKVSAGCKHCYAEALSKRNPGVLGVWGDSGTRVVASESKWREPLAWNKAAAKAGERQRVFCASLADVFEDREELEAPRHRLWDLIETTTDLDWLLLTKRPENLEGMLPWTSAHGGEYRERHWDNVWLGVSAEDQPAADSRIPLLLQTPAKVRFLSMEPLLGPVDLKSYLKMPWMPDRIVKPHSVPVEYMPVVGVDWCILGGESGPNARSCNVDWIRDIVKQCKDAGVACFVKQLGANAVWTESSPGMRATFALSPRLKDPHGGDPSEWPEQFPREFPT